MACFIQIYSSCLFGETRGFLANVEQWDRSCCKDTTHCLTCVTCRLKSQKSRIAYTPHHQVGFYKSVKNMYLKYPHKNMYIL